MQLLLLGILVLVLACNISAVPFTTVSLIAGQSNGTSGGFGDGGLAVNAFLQYPIAIAVDSARNIIFIAENSNKKVRAINRNTGIIYTYAGNGTSGGFGDGGLATAATVTPVALAYDDSLNVLYIGDIITNTVRVVNCSTGIITLFAGTGNITYNGEGLQATNTNIYAPYGVSVDPVRNMVYIAEYYGNRVRGCNRTTGICTTVAGQGGATGNSGDGGIATQAKLSWPTSANVDSKNNLLYIGDETNAIRFVNLTSGIINRFAGIYYGGKFAGDGGPALNASFLFAKNTYIDTVENMVYVPDMLSNRVRAINTTSGNITTVMGTGLTAFTDGITADVANFYYPHNIVIDHANNCTYVLEYMGHRLRAVSFFIAPTQSPTPTPTVTTSAPNTTAPTTLAPTTAPTSAPTTATPATTLNGAPSYGVCFALIVGLLALYT